jgi:hypothetical protein
VFATAVIAGTLAVKRTADLIPFCHPLPIDKCDIDVRLMLLLLCRAFPGFDLPPSLVVRPDISRGATRAVRHHV